MSNVRFFFVIAHFINEVLWGTLIILEFLIIINIS